MKNEQHDVDAMVNALRILDALDPANTDNLWFEIGRASMTLRLAIGRRADVGMKTYGSLTVLR